MIRTIATLLVAALAACAPVAPPPPSDVAAAVARPDIVAELNAARTDPAGYARKARALRGLLRGDRIERPGEIAVVTHEGAAAIDEAIAFLERQPPLTAVADSRPLTGGAAGHAADQAATGAAGHASADGSSPADRRRRQGRWSASGEAIAYGPDRAADVVLQLIVDDGVPDRGHRRILFNPAYTA